MKMGTVCSGILGAELAAPSHWEAAWCAEIDPFASRVIAHHRKDLHNHGDFTTIGPDAGPVDILAGGTPCQSFSIKGGRAGVDDPRGNLSLEFGRLARRVSAKWILWENVPGVLSVNGGGDAVSVLWTFAELGYHCAYRIFDAQFFGVPQRRRRLFAVGYLGDWRPPAAVLLEPESLSRNTPQVGAVGVSFVSRSSSRAEAGVSRTLCVKQRNDYWTETFVAEGPGLRELTPLERERLQGFPDHWTNIPSASLAARRKALGNAWPVPVARWIMARINTVNEVLQ